MPITGRKYFSTLLDRWCVSLAQPAAIFSLLSCIHSASAQTITWSGRQWKVTSGGMAGIAKGDPTNVSIDDQGYLHLRIVERDGKWTSSEVFTVERSASGPISGLSKATSTTWTSPAFSAYSLTGPSITSVSMRKTKSTSNSPSGTTPATAAMPISRFIHRPGTASRTALRPWEDNFQVSGAAITTARIEWAPDHIVFTLMHGTHAIGTTAEVIKAETYASDKKNIPQQAVPVGINLWCFRETPATTQSVIIRSFEFAPK